MKLESLRNLADKAIKIPPVCGLYFLWCDGRCVYIGQSVNVQQRIGEHSKTIIFDSVTIMGLPRADLNKAEQQYIQAYRPIYNKRHNHPVLRPRRRTLKERILSEKDEWLKQVLCAVARTPKGTFANDNAEMSH